MSARPAPSTEQWLELLACPACGAPVVVEVFEVDPRGGCQEGLLTCEACGSWYPWSDGIPRLLAEGPLRPDHAAFRERWRDRLPAEARSAPASASGGDPQVQAAFGHKWTHQPWWGMEGESARFMEEWLLPRYGFPGDDDFRRFLATRSTALDAGCGLGRESLRMARAAPRLAVVGLELSACVDEAARHARHSGVGNVMFVQGDLLAPPLRRAAFDYVVSEGVLHHTPDTRAAVASVARLVASGGELGFYVYRKKAPLREYADDFVRDRVSGLPPAEAWKLMEPLTRFGKALAETGATVDVPEDVPVLGIRAGRWDVQRLVYYTMFKCFWNDRLSFDENVHVNFDWYYPRFAWRHTESELRDWVREEGLRIVHETVEDSGVTLRVSRDAGAAQGEDQA